MRKALTPPEARMWLCLRRLRADGYHFRRQKHFKGYYLDFVCFSRRLVVEVDGKQHLEEAQALHDQRRDAVLAREGFVTLRIDNASIRDAIDDVMDHVVRTLRERPVWAEGVNQGGAGMFPTRPALRAGHPPHKGEGE
jgi:very-short-patch-repair endonuclease